jgi:hypothetical protein
VADYWQEGMRRMVRIADDPAFSLRLAHVTYRSLVVDPVGAIARIYDAFGLELSKEAREAMAAKVAQAPNGGYGANRYVRRNSESIRSQSASALRPMWSASASPASDWLRCSALREGHGLPPVVAMWNS